MWGEARDADGNRVEARQQGPEGYTITAIAALKIAEKILAGNFKPVFKRPREPTVQTLCLRSKAWNGRTLFEQQTLS
jgi:hypothetical protein